MTKKTAIIYPGQGAQYVGMGKDAAEAFAAAAEIFRDADAALGFSITDLVFNGGEADLTITENTQPALLTVCVALSAALGAEGIYPDVAAGLSIGEYAAHVLAGTFSFEEAVKTVRLRGKYMQEEVPAGEGGMAAILGVDGSIVEECCRAAVAIAMSETVASASVDTGADAGDRPQTVEPANYNCPGQIVIAGSANALKIACALCLERGARRALPLAVSAPFHCSLLRGAGEKLASVLSGVVLGKMRIPVVSNVTAEYVTEPEAAIALLERQVASPVRWEACVRTMLAGGVERFVEIGPGKTLAGFMKKIDASAEVINVSDAETLSAAIEFLKS